MPAEHEPADYMIGKDRVKFLLEVSRILRSSLDLSENLPELGRLIAPRVTDWFVVDVFQDDRLERVAAIHHDPGKTDAARELVGAYRRDDAPWGPARVMARRFMLIFPSIADPTLLAPKTDARQLAAVAELGLGAVLCMPMVVAGQLVGVLTFVRNPPRTPFGAVEMALARQVATRTGEAIFHGRVYRELQAASRSKDEFLAMLGHELRNPIGAILNAVKVLERAGSSDESAARVRAIIDRQAQHLGRLVDDLLDLSRITSGKITLRRRAVDLRKVAKRCVATHAGTGHDLVLDAESAVVSGDPTRLEQVLDNLVENSVKYTPPGGRIEVTVRRNAGSARLAIRDTGIGIAPELLPRIFDLFAQGAQALDRGRGGLGIGLTLVRRLVELHEGTITAFSAGTDQGTLVEVVLPLAPAAAAAAVAERVSPVGLARRILIVEDNVDARDALAELLSGDGHTVEVAKNGPQALEVTSSFRPDVALIDIGLPGMDGYDVARRLRALGGPPIHLVALTGYGQPADRQRTREAGFEVHLVKPVDPEDLARILAALDAPAAAS